MKTIKFIVMATFFVVSTSAMAQFTNTKPTGSSSIANTDGWNSFWVEWNPSVLSPKHGDSESFTAFSLGVSKAFSITSSAPVFLEPGFGAQYSFASDFMDIDDISFNMLSVKVPLSLIYKFDIPNSSFVLMPNAGLDFRFNILAKMSDDDDSISLFDKDDMGSGNTWNRFQIGWHIGLKACIGEGFLIGASYGTDFSEIADKLHVNTTTVSLGFTF